MAYILIVPYLSGESWISCILNASLICSMFVSIFIATSPTVSILSFTVISFGLWLDDNGVWWLEKFLTAVQINSMDDTFFQFLAWLVFPSNPLFCKVSSTPSQLLYRQIKNYAQVNTYFPWNRQDHLWLDHFSSAKPTVCLATVDFHLQFFYQIREINLLCFVPIINKNHKF